jgi:hypothetical protein
VNAQNVTVAININHCLARCGLNPDVPPLQPADPTAGPSSKPIKRRQLQVLCIEQTPNGDARDCGDLLHHNGLDMTLGWSVLSSRFDARAQSFASGGEQAGDQRKAQQLPLAADATSRAAAGELFTDLKLELKSVPGDVGLRVGLPRGVPGEDGSPRFMFAKRMEF